MRNTRPRATCIVSNPRDLNIMLIGYEGGVVAWDVQKATVARTFEMLLPPGEQWAEAGLGCSF